MPQVISGKISPGGVTVVKHFDLQGNNINRWDDVLVGGYTNELSGTGTLSQNM